MAVLYSPESEYAKERIKWEAYPSAMGPGLRPYVKHPWPAMWFRAEAADGGPVIAETVQIEEHQEAYYRTRGFAPTPLEAIEQLQRRDREIAKLAAERNFEVRRMSPQAQAEVAAFEADADGHQPVKPVTPIRKRGRPVKVKKEAPNESA